MNWLGSVLMVRTKGQIRWKERDNFHVLLSMINSVWIQINGQYNSHYNGIPIKFGMNGELCDKC